MDNSSGMRQILDREPPDFTNTINNFIQNFQAVTSQSAIHVICFLRNKCLPLLALIDYNYLKF